MRRRCAERNGFTLLEAVIALSLLVGMSAIALPMLFARSDRTAWAEARSRIESGVNIAQADARLAGRAFRVESDAGGDCVLRLVPIKPVEDEDQPAGEPRASDRGAPEGEFLSALPTGCSLAASEADEDSSGVGPIAAASSLGNAPKPELTPSVPESVLLGWVMPDGSFVSSGSVELSLDEHRASVAIDRWTGRVTIEETKTEESKPGGAFARGGVTP